MTTPSRKSTLFEKAALELGHITMEWARLEGSLNEFLRVLTPLEEDTLAQIYYGNTDLRGKIQIALAIGFHRKVDVDWFSDFQYLLNYVDNNLRPRRNAVIHAEWFVPKRKLVRRTHKTKFLRPQAFQTTLETQQNIPVNIKELRILKEDMRICWLATLPLTFFLYGDEGNLRPLTSPDISYRQYLRAAKLDDLPRQLRKRPQPRPSASLLKLRGD